MEENSAAISSITKVQIIINEPQMSPIKTRSQSRKDSLTRSHSPGVDGSDSKSSNLKPILKSPLVSSGKRLKSPFKESPRVAFVNDLVAKSEKDDDYNEKKGYDLEGDKNNQIIKSTEKTIKKKVSIGKSNNSANINPFEIQDKTKEVEKSPIKSASKISKIEIHEIKTETETKPINEEFERTTNNETKENKEISQDNIKEDVHIIETEPKEEIQEKAVKKKVSIGKGKPKSSTKTSDDDNQQKEDKDSSPSKESNFPAPKIPESSEKTSIRISKTPIKKMNSIEQTIAEAHIYLSKVTSPKNENSVAVSIRTRSHAKTSSKKPIQESAKKPKNSISDKSKPKSAIKSKIDNTRTMAETIAEGRAFLESLEEKDKDEDEVEDEEGVVTPGTPNKLGKKSEIKINAKKLKMSKTMAQTIVEGEAYIKKMDKKARDKELAAESDKDVEKISISKKIVRTRTMAETIKEGQAWVGNLEETGTGKRRRKTETAESTDDEGDKIEKKMKT